MNHIHLRKVFIMFALLFIMQHNLVILPAMIQEDTYYREASIKPCNNYPSYDSVVD